MELGRKYVCPHPSPFVDLPAVRSQATYTITMPTRRNSIASSHFRPSNASPGLHRRRSRRGRQSCTHIMKTPYRPSFLTTPIYDVTFPIVFGRRPRLILALKPSLPSIGILRTSLTAGAASQRWENMTIRQVGILFYGS